MTTYFNDRLKSSNDSLILADTYLFSKAFMKKLTSKFQNKMEKQSVEDLKEPKVVLAFRTEHAVIAGSSQSTVVQHTETKKKKGKKAQQTSSSNVQDENLVEIAFIDKTSLEKDLREMINDLNDDLLENLVEHFLK